MSNTPHEGMLTGIRQLTDTCATCNVKSHDIFENRTAACNHMKTCLNGE